MITKAPADNMSYNAGNNESKYRAIFENMLDAFVCLSLTGRIIEYNKAFCDMLGYTGDELKNKTYFDVISEKRRGSDEKTFNDQLLTKGSTQVYEMEFIKKDGTVFPVEIRNYLTKNESGTVGNLWAIIRDISERKKMEVQLVAENNFSKSLIETAQVIIVVLNDQGKIVLINPYFEKLSGYGGFEVNGQDWFSTFLPPRDRTLIRDLFIKITSDIEANGVVNPIVCKDGREIEIEWYSKTLKDKTSKTIGLLSIGLDISERKIKEKILVENRALKKTGERFRAMIENLPAGAVYIENETVSFNKEIEKITGYSNDEIKTVDQWFKKLYPEKHEFELNEYKTRREKGFLSTTSRIITQSGETRHVDFAGYKSDDIELWLIYDVTDRVLAEEALWLSYESYRMVADYTLDWEYWRAPDGKYLYVSPACEDITGYSAAEFIEDSDLIVKITHPEDKNIIAGHFNNLDNNIISDICVIEFRIVTKSGEIKYIEHRCRQVYRSVGTWIGYRGSNKDITERKRFEKALESERDRANAATSAKSLFLAKMSHEIRTPMNSVLGFANLLKMTALNGEQSEYVNILSDSAEKLLGIINDILDISKIEAGKLTLNQYPFDLRNLVLDCVRLLNFAARSKNIYLKEEFDEKLCGLMIGDETRLRQIIINLINNAIKFTQAGGVKLTVSLLNETEDCVEAAFAVADTGTGIAPHDINNIFEKYIQADSESYCKNTGTGLGLTIVKNLLDLMGGTISVKSEPGVGSEFLVKIKFLKATGEAGPKADAGVYGAAHDRKHAGKKIKLLIAEDEPSSRQLMQKIVEMKGWEASIVSNGNAVIEMAASGDYDAILMDIQLPGLDGISAAKSIGRAFRENGRKMTPIAALTAGAMPGEIQECAEAGMDCVILKPLNVSDFYNKIEKLIESGKK